MRVKSCILAIAAFLFFAFADIAVSANNSVLSSTVSVQIVLAHRQANISAQEDASVVAHRLASEAFEDAQKHPCIKAAFRRSDEINIFIRVSMWKDDVSVDVVAPNIIRCDE